MPCCYRTLIVPLFLHISTTLSPLGRMLKTNAIVSSGDQLRTASKGSSCFMDLLDYMVKQYLPFQLKIDSESTEGLLDGG
jgi:hypothetical protein